MADGDGVRLIVGLGNPGARYERTRHNAGFWFVDALSRAHGVRFHHEAKFDGEATRIEIGGTELWLFKPMTFMNRSGHALRLMSAFYKIPLANVLVAHDEIDLPLGVARLKYGGGHGGHNGLRDIFAHLGQAFWRLRLGVGHPGERIRVVDYLTESRPTAEERQSIMRCIEEALTLVPQLAAGEFGQAMQQLHTA
jgi:PTH1 family peptidyl-tRNA hydrolase